MSLSKPKKPKTEVVKEEIKEENEWADQLQYLQCCVGCGRDRGPMPPIAKQIAKVGILGPFIM